MALPHGICTNVACICAHPCAHVVPTEEGMCARQCLCGCLVCMNRQVLGLPILGKGLFEWHDPLPVPIRMPITTSLMQCNTNIRKSWFIW